MSDNIYSSPHTPEEEVRTVDDKSALRDLATAHRRVILGLLSGIIFILVNGLVVVILKSHPNDVLLLIDELLVWVMVGIFLFNAIAIYRLASMIRPEQAIGVLYILLLLFLFPVGFFMVWRLCRRATKILNANGIQVGFIGAEEHKRAN